MDVRETKEEISLYKSKLEKFRKALPRSILVCLVVIFLFPILPGRTGKTWLDERDYWSGVVFAAILSLTIVPVGYFVVSDFRRTYFLKDGRPTGNHVYVELL